MPMRLELGALTVEVERQEDAVLFLQGLLKHVNNLEVAELLGVTAKTVQRWRRSGLLPKPEGGQLTLLELFQRAHTGRATEGTSPATGHRRASRAAVRGSAGRRLREGPTADHPDACATR